MNEAVCGLHSFHSFCLGSLAPSLLPTHHYKPLEEEVWFVVEEVHVVISVHGGGRGTGQSRELLLLI